MGGPDGGESPIQALHGARLGCKPVPGKGDRRSLAVRQVEHGAGRVALAVWQMHIASHFRLAVAAHLHCDRFVPSDLSQQRQQQQRGGTVSERL